MQVKRYEAVDMNEAIRQVKNDLGPEAIILSSRHVKKGGGKFGVFGRPIVEVTAAVDTPAIAESKARPHPYRRAVMAGRYMENPRLETLKSSAISIEPILDGIEDIRKKFDSLGQKEDQTPLPGAHERISDEVRELKSLVSFLVDQSLAEKNIHEHKNYLALARRLKEQGVAPEYIMGLIKRVKQLCGEGPTPDVKTLARSAVVEMRGSLTFGGALAPVNRDDGVKRTVALVGPTGVGKTTTIAKLSARLTSAGVKVGLVTIDTYRIAAVEQLKIYAKILKIPMEVALEPSDLERAVRSFRGLDVVLVDTAGRSQRDREQIEELNRFTGPTMEIETMLVLSASSSEKQMEQSIRSFSAAQADGLIFTKLDEAETLGPVYNQQVRTGIPISYFTTGQKVPEDIEEASARRLLGGIFGLPRQSLKQ